MTRRLKKMARAAIRLLGAPQFSDPEKSLRAALLHTATLSFAGFVTLLLILPLPFGPRPLPVFLFYGPVLLSQVLMRRGRVRAAGISYLIAISLVFSWSMLYTGGISVFRLSAYALVLLTALVLAGRGAAYLVGGLALLSGGAIFALQAAAMLPIPASGAFTAGATFSDILIHAALVCQLVYLCAGAYGAVRNRWQDVRQESARLRVDLATRMEEQTHALTEILEIGRHMARLVDPDQLIEEVSQKLQNTFGYSHVLVYLHDPEGGRLRLAGGSGPRSEDLWSEGHSIKPGHGLVGRAAQSGLPVLVSDFSADPDWTPNPVFPETKCETALSLRAGEALLGVLNLHRPRGGGLDAFQAQLLQEVAGKLAESLQSASLYDQAHLQADREALINHIDQKIQSAATIEDVLMTAARELGQALKIERASLLLSVQKDAAELAAMPGELPGPRRAP